jgi:hypothetical protein
MSTRSPLRSHRWRRDRASVACERRRIRLCARVAAAFFITLAIPGVAAASTYLVKPGDFFTVAGTKLLCSVRKEATMASSVQTSCFLFRSMNSANPILGSYAFSIGPLGIAVLREDRTPKVVYTTQYSASYKGVIAPRAPRRRTGTLTLHAGDAIRVASTDIGCVVLPFPGGTPTGIWCKPILASYSNFDPLEVSLSGLRVVVAHSGKFLRGLGPTAYLAKQP